MIPSVSSNNEFLENNFPLFVKFVGSEVTRTKTRRKSHVYGKKRIMRKFQTKNIEGRGGGNSNIRNHNNSNHKGQHMPISKGMKMGGIRITNHYYKDFAKLISKQKDAIRELKKYPNFESKTQISGTNANSDGTLNLYRLQDLSQILLKRYFLKTLQENLILILSSIMKRKLLRG